MTILIRYCYIIILVVLTSCTTEERLNTKMDHIKEVGDTNPTYAKTMLDSLEMEVRSMSTHTQMRYDLLSIRLDDKADKIPTSDFMAKEMLDFFIHNGNEREKQEAFYYAASVYRDLNDTPKSMEYFLESCRIGETNSGIDSIMLRNTYSQLTFLYTNVQNYKQAFEMAKKEYHIAQKMNVITLTAIIHYASTCVNLDSIDLAKDMFRKALTVLKRTNDFSRNRDFIFCTLMNMSNLKMPEAHECFTILSTIGHERTNIEELNALSSYYKFANMPDSAIACCNYILENSNDALALYDASRKIFKIYQAKGDLASANKYAQKFIEINEEYNMGKRQEIAATTNNRFQYHRNKEEEQRIKDEKNWYLMLSIISGISLLLCAAVFMAFYTHKRNKHLKRALEMANEMNAIRADNEGMAIELRRKEEELSVAMQNLNNTKDRLDNVNSELEKYNRELKEKEKQLEGKIEQNKSLIRMLSLSETESAAEEIIARIRKASDGQYAMKPKDWRGLYHAVDELYPDFRDSIARNLGNFSEQEMQVCYLMRAGLDNRHIQNVMPMSRATIWRWTKRMHWISRP